MTACICTVTILNFNRQCSAATIMCVTIQTACITGNRFFPGIIRRLHTVTSCTEFRRVRFLRSYHNQRNTAYERDDSYYGQYFDTLSISFSNFLQHDKFLPRILAELHWIKRLNPMVVGNLPDCVVRAGAHPTTANLLVQSCKAELISVDWTKHFGSDCKSEPALAIKGLRNLCIEELETVYGKFMNSSILKFFPACR